MTFRAYQTATLTFRLRQWSAGRESSQALMDLEGRTYYVVRARLDESADPSDAEYAYVLMRAGAPHSVARVTEFVSAEALDVELEAHALSEAPA